MCNDLDMVSRVLLSFGRELGMLLLVHAFQWLTLELILPARPAANTIPLRTSSIRHCCFVERWDIGGGERLSFAIEGV